MNHKKVLGHVYIVVICSKYAYNMLMPQNISVQKMPYQLSVNFGLGTFKFLFFAEISNMLVYIVDAGFP